MEPESKTYDQQIIQAMAARVLEIREQDDQPWDRNKMLQLYAGLLGHCEEFLENRGMLPPDDTARAGAVDRVDDDAGSNSSGYKIKKGFGTDVIQ